MNGSDSFFVDTNLLLYEFSEAEPTKQAKSVRWLAHLWETRAARISWQVMVEFYANAVYKIHVPMPTARATTNRLLEWHPQAPTHASLLRAWHWCDAAQINFWDALIVAAAEQAGCRYLLSEDFQAGRRFGDLLVVNPFERPPEEFA